MTTLRHPFSRRQPGGESVAFDGEYHFTPVTPRQGERHSHEHYELYIHLHGGNLFSLERELFPMEPNQLVIIPPYRMQKRVFSIPSAQMPLDDLHLLLETDIQKCPGCLLDEYF